MAATILGSGAGARTTQKTTAARITDILMIALIKIKHGQCDQALAVRWKTPRTVISLLVLAGPWNARVRTVHRAQTLVDELLHALAAVGFGGVDVALGVGGDAVQGVELARLASAISKAVDFGH